MSEQCQVLVRTMSGAGRLMIVGRMGRERTSTMTRILALSAMALMGLSTLASGQTKSTCGPETWSTDKMAYVGTPCPDGPGVAPQQASARTDLQYCGALVASYDEYVNKAGKSAGMQSTNNAANVAAAKCRAGDVSGIPDLERALADAQVALPRR